MKGSFKAGIFARAGGWLKNILYAAPTLDIVGFGGAGFPRFSPVHASFLLGLCVFRPPECKLKFSDFTRLPYPFRAR